MRTKYLFEYRILKKGCECYRSRNWEDIQKKLAELTIKYPRTVYQTQARSVQLNRAGVPVFDASGKALWTSWR